jgi:DNA-binding transcriptional ArsR family regulator
MKERFPNEQFSKEAKNLLLQNEKTLEGELKLIALLSNPTRLKMAFLLSKKELCINDLETVLDVDQTLISHYMRAFKDLNLARERREGRRRFYSINDKKIQDFFKAIRIPIK